MAGPTRQDTFRVTVFINGINFGVWDKKTGGQVDSEQTSYKPGGMTPPVSLGGSKNVDNIVVSRLYRQERDHTEVGRLMNWAGKADMSVHQQPLDFDAQPFGNPIVWRGTLKRVMAPDVDSESNDAAMLELEMTVDGYPVV